MATEPQPFIELLTAVVHELTSNEMGRSRCGRTAALASRRLPEHWSINAAQRVQLCARTRTSRRLARARWNVRVVVDLREAGGSGAPSVERQEEELGAADPAWRAPGARVPTFLHWPVGFPAGRCSDAVCACLGRARPDGIGTRSRLRDRREHRAA